MSEEQNLDLVQSAPEADTTQEPQARVKEPVSTAILDEEPEAQNPSPEPEEAESTSESEDKGDSELPKGIQKRLSKLTKQKYEQQAKIEALEQEVLKLREQPQGAQKTREDFASEDEYLDYKFNSSLDQRFKEEQLERERQALATEQVKLAQEMWAEKVQATQEVLPDYAEVVGSSDIQLPYDALEFIEVSPQGPQLAYHLAKHPEVAENLRYLDERSRDRELMRLEFELKSASYVQPKPVTKAQPTPKSIGRAGGVTSLDQIDMRDFVKMRNKQLGR